MDGCAFAAADLRQRLTKDDREKGVSWIEVDSLVDAIIWCMEIAVRWVISNAGQVDNATVVVGISSQTGETHQPVEPMLLCSSVMSKLPNTRQLTDEPRSVLQMDLRAVQGIQKRLALDHRVAAALLQWFGVAQPVQITADGLINPEGWHAANKSAATQWQASVQISRP